MLNSQNSLKPRKILINSKKLENEKMTKSVNTSMESQRSSLCIDEKLRKIKTDIKKELR